MFLNSALVPAVTQSAVARTTHLQAGQAPQRSGGAEGGGGGSPLALLPCCQAQGWIFSQHSWGWAFSTTAPKSPSLRAPLRALTHAHPTETFRESGPALGFREGGLRPVLAWGWASHSADSEGIFSWKERASGSPVHRPCVTSPVPTSVRDRPDVTLAISLPPGKLLSLTHREKQTLPSRSSGPWGCTEQSGVTLSLTLRDGVKTVGGTSALSGSAALPEVEADGGWQGGSGGPGVQTLGKADDEVLVGSGVRYMSRRLELGGTQVAKVTPPTTWGASEETKKR